MQDYALYECFFQRPGGGLLDFAGLPELEIFEQAHAWLHPERATQWWSWFRLCGVTYSMLESHGHDAQARERIWQVHHKWSSQYSNFCEDENREMVMRCRGKRVSGLPLLIRLVRFDNPDMEVRTTRWKIHTPLSRQQGTTLPADALRTKPELCTQSKDAVPGEVVTEVPCLTTIHQDQGKSKSWHQSSLRNYESANQLL